jgi:hypothetical protein
MRGALFFVLSRASLSCKCKTYQVPSYGTILPTEAHFISQGGIPHESLHPHALHTFGRRLYGA